MCFVQHADRRLAIEAAPRRLQPMPADDKGVSKSGSGWHSAPTRLSQRRFSSGGGKSDRRRMEQPAFKNAPLLEWHGRLGGVKRDDFVACGAWRAKAIALRQVAIDDKIE